jgi:hypothetical protein
MARHASSLAHRRDELNDEQAYRDCSLPVAVLSVPGLRALPDTELVLLSPALLPFRRARDRARGYSFSTDVESRTKGPARGT